LRHADTVDVKFILVDEHGARTEKTVAAMHPDLLQLSGKSGRKMDDAWCSRMAALHLKHMVETGEDMDKDLVTIPAADLERYSSEIAGLERTAVQRG
jgi:hypothetical protein